MTSRAELIEFCKELNVPYDNLSIEDMKQKSEKVQIKSLIRSIM